MICLLLFSSVPRTQLAMDACHSLLAQAVGLGHYYSPDDHPDITLPSKSLEIPTLNQKMQEVS